MRVAIAGKRWLITDMGHLMRIRNGNTIIFMLICLFAKNPAYAFDTESYVDGSKPFTLIEDVNRQAEAWAICSSAFLIISELYESQPAQAKMFKETSNGASLAVIMTHVMDGMNDDITPSKFDSLWKYSKLLGKELPATQMTMIMADAESQGSEGIDKFWEKIINTTKVCSENIDGQQAYIDTWRGLAKSGLLKLPD